MNPTTEGKIETPNWPVRIEIDPEVYTDELTGLRNRRWVKEKAPDIIRESKEQGLTTGLIMADLDGFKDINDTQGHAAGDLYLQNVAEAFDENLRHNKNDRTGDAIRFSGDEFAALLPGIHGNEDVELVIERLQKDFDKRGVKVSLGYVVHDGKEELPDFLDRGDTAMYKIKAERKLNAHDAEQHEAVKRIGAIAAEHQISLRDIPGLHKAIEERDNGR